MTKHFKEAAVVEAARVAGKIEVTEDRGTYTVAVTRDGATTSNQYTLISAATEAAKKTVEIEWKQAEIRYRQVDGSPQSTIDALEASIKTLSRDRDDLVDAMRFMR